MSTQVSVTVPKGLAGGDTMQITHHGQPFNVVVPEGLQAGDTFTAQIQAAGPQPEVVNAFPGGPPPYQPAQAASTPASSVVYGQPVPNAQQAAAAAAAAPSPGTLARDLRRRSGTGATTAKAFPPVHRDVTGSVRGDRVCSYAWVSERRGGAHRRRRCAWRTRPAAGALREAVPRRRGEAGGPRRPPRCCKGRSGLCLTGARGRIAAVPRASARPSLAVPAFPWSADHASAAWSQTRPWGPTTGQSHMIGPGGASALREHM
eukprot:CAMPEP_0206005838 /NCGR_PEP_ID=MMETSP1464-20131121/4825_1 /ASSEMBLY_ACC=CAM_ASM_001124 /TAXON_ID=119497 /ORGANISM="Exanthemachrysis gayraliae, Strain RCC1523" /LENGTH=260 /DNA_ID=CAMNT_0053379297 /DNA_START=58 /DNA_END=843 /DNA_ORIENTATION=+